MDQKLRSTNAIKGALIADAATLGTHWIYDVPRISEITDANDGSASFVKIDPANYEGVPSYFAHGNRSDGSNTQYGEVLKTALKSIIDNNGNFDVEKYQESFVAHFGPGGTYLSLIHI